MSGDVGRLLKTLEAKFNRDVGKMFKEEVLPTLNASLKEKKSQFCLISQFILELNDYRIQIVINPFVAINQGTKVVTYTVYLVVSRWSKDLFNENILVSQTTVDQPNYSKENINSLRDKIVEEVKKVLVGERIEIV